MKAVPLELKDANAFVEKLHRHHAPVHRDKRQELEYTIKTKRSCRTATIFVWRQQAKV